MIDKNLINALIVETEQEPNAPEEVTYRRGDTAEIDLREQQAEFQLNRFETN